MTTTTPNPPTKRYTDMTVKEVQKRRDRIEAIMAIVARHCAHTVEDLRGYVRTQKLALDRQIAMALCRELTAAPYETIAQHFHRLDHTTVIYSCRVIRELVEVQPGIRERVEEMRKLAKEGAP